MKNQRRKYLINPHFQWDIIIKFTLLFALNTLIFCIGVSYFFEKISSQGAAVQQPGQYFQGMNNQYYLMTITLILVSFINLIIFILFGIYLSNKIAGPLYRLRVHLEQMTKLEELKEVQFRKDDYFKELENGFNTFIKRIKKTDK
ncbi:MAG: hypothetical protein AB7I27_18785 [Bacteriovoracaceae bacterium]